MSQTFTLMEVAGLLSVSRSAVEDWLKRGCPFVEQAERSQGKSWKLSLPDVVAWLRKRDVDQAIGDTSKWDIDEAKLRKTAAEAALAELELSKQRGEVIPISVVTAVVAKQVAACKARLNALPTKMAPLVAPVTDVIECRDLLTIAKDEALDELVGYGSAGLGDIGADGEAGQGDPGDLSGRLEAPADPVRKRVGRPRKTPKP